MKRKGKILLFALSFLCVAVFAVAAGGPAQQDLRAKARYFYLKGAVCEAEGRIDEAYEFYRKAYNTDPSYLEGAFSYGFSRLSIDSDTFQTDSEAARSLELMRGYVDAFPRDIESAQTYAYFAAMADTLPEAIRVYSRLVEEYPGKSTLYVPQAMLFMQVGETERAVQAMREYERLEGPSSETTIRKVSYYVAAGDTLAALREVKTYADENPGKPAPLIDKAMVYHALGRSDTAIVVLEDALRQFPDNSDMKVDLALIYVNQGDTARFHKLISEAVHAEDLDYDDRMETLRLYVKNLPVGAADYSESDKVFEYVHSLYPRDPVFLDLYGGYALTKGDYGEALDHALESLALDPGDNVLLGRVLSYSVLAGRPEEGLKAYDEFPDEGVKATSNLAITYITVAEQAKEYDTALQASDRYLRSVIAGLSLADTPQTVDSIAKAGNYSEYELYMASVAYEIAGDIYSRMGEKENAVREYENAIALPVDNNSVLNNYAYYLVDKLGYAPGTPEFERAKELSYRSITATQEEPESNYYDTYAWILFREQNYREALDYQEVAVDLGKDSPSAELYSHYGDILFMNGRPDDAVAAWQKALELEPDNDLLKRKVEHKTFFYE